MPSVISAVKRKSPEGLVVFGIYEVLKKWYLQLFLTIGTMLDGPKRYLGTAESLYLLFSASEH